MEIEYINELPGGYCDSGWDRHSAETYTNHYKRRQELRARFAFAIPTAHAIKTILGLGTEIVEIGAGTGYWAYLLSEAGGTVRAYDSGAWTMFTDNWFAVKRGGPGMIRFYQDAVVLLVWPPCDKPLALEVAERVHVGQHLVYVGEGYGGCCGSDEFFDFLEENFERLGGCSIPQWSGIHDSLSIYRRVK